VIDNAQAHAPLIRIEDLKKHIPIGHSMLSQRKIKAVDGITVGIRRGETLGLVGESGCGKSTLGRMLALIDHATSGHVWFGERDLLALSEKDRRLQRLKIQFVFQDASASLNPKMKIGRIIEDPLYNFNLVRTREEALKIRREIMVLCGLPEFLENRYPHQLSGGQKQRVGIARALIIGPEVLIADEPVSALDVSIQAQILNLFAELRRRMGLTIVFISHDLAAVRHISDRIAVMYLGKLVELASADETCTSPLHPYTAALISSSPVPDPKAERQRKPIALRGEIPSPVDPPTGCRFHTRCPIARFPKCSDEEPQLVPHETAERLVACHFAGELRL
jgi:oligopeptide/dipeptide ABC transporter ATP-binding protein